MIEQSILDKLASKQDLMLQQTIELANINSGSLNLCGLEKVASKLEQLFAPMARKFRVKPLNDLQQYNDKGQKISQPLGKLLHISSENSSQIKILLVGHYDTVFGADHPFQKVTLLDDNKINGPGVADLKGGLVVMLHALQALESSSHAGKIDWQIIINPDEEIGSPGSKQYIMDVAKQNKYGLVFEPAISESGILAGERKGSAKYTLISRGKSAHAGRSFSAGKNAICHMGKVITAIDKLNQTDDITINVGTINGGTAVNTVPDCCVVRLDIRFKKLAAMDWITDNMQKIANEFNKNADYRLEVHGGISKQPKIFDEKTLNLYNLAKTTSHKLGMDLTWQPSGGCCDGNNLSAAGLPNIDTLGVRGGNIHTIDEYMIVSSLVERSQLLYAILVNLIEEH